MAIIRELTTILDFRVDKTGLNAAEGAISSLKVSLTSLGKLFGFVFAADKLFEMVDELNSAAKEVIILEKQITRMARAGDNVTAAFADLQNVAQETGVEYNKILDTYRELINESKESKVTQDQILFTIENIYKGLRLGEASTEQINNTFAALNRAFRIGHIGVRQFGLLVDEAPEVINAMSAALGKTREQLTEMAKDGKLTADVMINALGRSITALDTEFAKRPRKLGEAFTYAWNKALLLVVAIRRIVGMTGFVANAVIRLTDIVANGLQRLTNLFGGLERMIRSLGIILAIVFGPRLIRSLQLAVIWTTRWIATNAIILAQYAAMALAVFGIFLAIEDIITWMQGGDSIIGDWLGPFDQFSKKVKDIFENSDFFAPFMAFKKFVEGDFSGAWEKLAQSMRDVNGLLGSMIFLVGAVWIGFRIWNTLKFFGLIEGLGLIATALGGVKTAAVAASTAVAAIPGTTATKLGMLGKLGVLGGAVGAAIWGKELMQGGFDAIRDFLSGPGTSQQRREEFKKRFGAYPGELPGVTPATPAPSATTPTTPTTPDTITPTPTTPATPPVIPAPNVPGMITPGQIIVPPGPGATQNNNTTVQQNNTVTVTVDPNASTSVLDQIKGGLVAAMEAWSRQAKNAAPVIESPTR